MIFALKLASVDTNFPSQVTDVYLSVYLISAINNTDVITKFNFKQ